MTKDVVDKDSESEVLQPGDTITLEVDSQHADTVFMSVDGGESGVRAPTYNISTEVDQDVGFGFQETDEITITRSKALTHTDEAYGRYMRFELENVNGLDGEYRFVVSTTRERL